MFKIKPFVFFHFRFVAGILLMVQLAGCAQKMQPAQSVAKPVQWNITPLPAQMQAQRGTLRFTNRVHFSADPATQKLQPFAAAILEDAMQLQLVTGERGSNTSLRLLLDSTQRTKLGQEGYQVLVAPTEVRITGASEAGVFYGLQTLKQMLQQAAAGNKELACVAIEDQPRFGWRAFMLDEGRYFKGMDVVKKLLDEMAHLKLNVFHWHLSDDQGWRIEIKKYPLLTETGSRRDSSQTGGWNSPRYDGKVHEGFYTQEQIREIVQYAAARYITIIPEIDMPGHFSAAIAAYPWLEASGTVRKVATKFGPQTADVLNVTDPKVQTFVEDVLLEVAALFPSQVLHIGGDEVNYGSWKGAPAVMQFIADNGMQNPAELQIWFTNKVSRFLESKGRRMMGWNEIVGVPLHDYHAGNVGGTKEKLAPNTLVHFWKGDTALIRDALQKGFDIVNSFHEYTYLDYDYNQTPLTKAYAFEPLPPGITAQQKTQVLGLGCQMWGEWIPTVESMEQRIFPRIAAFAETGWTPLAQKDYTDFKKRLEALYVHWQKRGIAFTRL